MKTQNHIKIILLMCLGILMLSCSKDDMQDENFSNLNAITNFTLHASKNAILDKDFVATINQENKTINIVLKSNTELTALNPTISISQGASIFPEGIQDFRVPVYYEITAEDGAKQIYTVNIITEKQILISLYLANPSNTLNWELNEPILENNWEGVSLDSYGYINSIILNNKNLSYLPSSLSKLFYLYRLNLDNNNINKIDSEISQLENLIVLSLKSNNFKKNIPEEVWELKKIKFLYLNNNGLTFIPDGIGNLEDLTLLDAANNEITIIPEAMKLNTKIEQLGFFKNKIQSLPVFLTELNNVTSIILAYNNISDITKEIGNMKNLTTITLNDNDISVVPKELGQLTQLKYLLLRNNNIVQVYSEICALDTSNGGNTNVDIVPGVVCY